MPLITPPTMHRQADMAAWRGRIDEAEGVLGRRWHQVVRPLDDSDAGQGIALVGFACDAGVARNQGRTGAAAGPAAIRAALGNMPVHRCTSIADAGDIVCIPHAEVDGLEDAQQALAQVVADILERGKLPIALGGGHEIAYGSFSGLARHLALRNQAPTIAVINLDAHFDLRQADRPSSGTPFRQIAEDCHARGWPFQYCCLGVSHFANTQALFERARMLGARWLPDEEMTSANLAHTLAVVNDCITKADHVYLTVCLDVLPAFTAPGVSAPAARGVSLEVIEPIVDAVTMSGKLRVADIAELNPDWDIDQRTARVAARLAARIAERAGI